MNHSKSSLFLGRRQALATIGAAGLALTAVRAYGQEPVRRVALLASTPIPERIRAWEQALAARGYHVGQNLQIDYRYFHGQDQQIAALVGELAALRPEVFVTSTSNSATVIHDVAPTTPMVFFSVADPVGLGLVNSLAHPGGTATGLATLDPQAFIAKQLQVLKELVPKASRIAVLVNPAYGMHRLALAKLPEAARVLKVELLTVEARSSDQYDTAFEKAHAQNAEAIQIWNGPLIFVNAAKIISLAAHHHLPAMYFDRSYVVDGGLVSYAPDSADFWRGAAEYVDKILKGEKPGDLPVQQPTHYYLTINLKTARALGIALPPSFLAQADEVIE
jgi:ABC-type uncharacterized transport system substrate-binding protein